MESSEDRVRSLGHIAHWGHEGSASFMQDSKMKLRPKAKTSAASMDPNAANRSNGNVGYSSSCPAPPPRARNPRVVKNDSTLAVVLTKSTGADCPRKYGGGQTHGQRHCGWCICQVREHPLTVAIKAACVWPQKLTGFTASWHFLKMLIVLHHTKDQLSLRFRGGPVSLSTWAIPASGRRWAEIAFSESENVGKKYSNIFIYLFIFVTSSVTFQYTRNASTSGGCWWGGTAPAPCVAPI